jgi:Cu+-exporting ATPase
MVATGRGADLGLLFKDGEALQRLEKVGTVVLDKTGTVTTGKPAVTDLVLAAGWSSEDLMGLAGGLEQGSEHPVALALVDYVRKEGVDPGTLDEFSYVPGRGAVGRVSGRRVVMGNAALLRENGVDIAAFESRAGSLARTGKTCLFIAVDGTAAGLVAVADTLKPGSVAAIRELRDLGVRVVLVTGDHRRTAEAIAAEIGVEEVHAEVLPEGKVENIRSLQSRGQVVAMVGDGINDAAALAQADVGLALAGGADIAVEAGDVTLMHPDLGGVVRAVRISREAMRVMRQNLFWAFFYNVVGIPIAAGVLYPFWGVQLSPVLAGAAMAFSSVSVITNSLRLRRAVR